MVKLRLYVYRHSSLRGQVTKVRSRQWTRYLHSNFTPYSHNFSITAIRGDAAFVVDLCKPWFWVIFSTRSDPASAVTYLRSQQARSSATTRDNGFHGARALTFRDRERAGIENSKSRRYLRFPPFSMQQILVAMSEGQLTQSHRSTTNPSSTNRRHMFSTDGSAPARFLSYFSCASSLRKAGTSWRMRSAFTS